jgi:hypothetical protein
MTVSEKHMQNANSVAERATLQGWVPELAAENEIREALEKAFDYRGDVTITKKDGTIIEGYIFDRKSALSLHDSLVRVLPKDSNQRQSISYADIAAVVFSGRDTAAGKSWEAWVRKYWEKRAAGETYNLSPDTQE